jgi:glycosyltransferase involved in cell wall biosynthesis
MLAPAVVEARVIPNGIDLAIFRPGTQHLARAVLGIPQDTALLLAVGGHFRRSPWKDYETLRAVVARVADVVDSRPVLCIVLGDEGPPEQVGRGTIQFKPYTRDRTAVAEHYRAADVYLHPAVADTFPNTILESLACGTPVVAASVSGIPEQIEDGAYGFLVPPSDVRGMASRAAHLLVDGEHRNRMARCAIGVARERFDLALQVERYLALYRRILGEWPARERMA